MTENLEGIHNKNLAKISMMSGAIVMISDQQKTLDFYSQKLGF